MPAYYVNKWYAVVFVLFIIICMYIFLAIVLAVVYENYRKYLLVSPSYLPAALPFAPTSSPCRTIPPNQPQYHPCVCIVCAAGISPAFSLPLPGHLQFAVFSSRVTARL